MPATQIRISYDGPSLSEHEMEVRALAPALLAFGNLMERSAHVVYGPGVRLRVNVRGSFRTGSFGADLVPEFLNWWDLAKDILTSQTANALANLAEFVGVVAGSGYGLLRVLQWLRGRSVKDSITLDNGLVRIRTEDGDSIDISREVYNLLQDPKVRAYVQEVIHDPLAREGIDEFLAADASNDPENPEPVHYVNKASAPYYQAPTNRKVGESEIEQLVQIVAPSFNPENKWRIRSGDSTFAAAMSDTNFLERVQRGGERFGAGDMMRVRMRTIQFMTPEKLTAEHEITEVLDHFQPSIPESVPLHDPSREIRPDGETRALPGQPPRSDEQSNAGSTGDEGESE